MEETKGKLKEKKTKQALFYKKNRSRDMSYDHLSKKS